MVVEQSQHDFLTLDLGAKVIEAPHELVVHEDQRHGVPVVLLTQPLPLFFTLRSSRFDIGVLPFVLFDQLLGVTAVWAVVSSVYDNLHQKL